MAKRTSDNLIDVPDISATDASRRFADLLDAVEHRGERYTIVRRGKVVARLEPAEVVRGAGLKHLLRAHAVDDAWASEVVALRSQLEPEDRW